MAVLDLDRIEETAKIAVEMAPTVVDGDFVSPCYMDEDEVDPRTVAAQYLVGAWASQVLELVNRVRELEAV